MPLDLRQITEMVDNPDGRLAAAILPAVSSIESVSYIAETVIAYEKCKINCLSAIATKNMEAENQVVRQMCVKNALFAIFAR